MELPHAHDRTGTPALRPALGGARLARVPALPDHPPTAGELPEMPQTRLPPDRAVPVPSRRAALPRRPCRGHRPGPHHQLVEGEPRRRPRHRDRALPPGPHRPRHPHRPTARRSRHRTPARHRPQRRAATGRQARRRPRSFTMLGGEYRFTGEHLEAILRLNESTPSIEVPEPSRAEASPRRRRSEPRILQRSTVAPLRARPLKSRAQPA